MKRILFGYLFLATISASSAQEVDSIIDIRDGQEYRIVLIGNQWWMQENLNIGISIDDRQDAIDNNIIEKYCSNNDNNLCETYGGLYQWNEMMDYYPSDEGNPSITQGICPIGWYLPTDEEWKELEMVLGMSQNDADASGIRGTNEGGKLKEAGTIHWEDPNFGATNESGFTALPGGSRVGSGGFYRVGPYAWLWSSTEQDNSAWRRYLNYDYSEVVRYHDYKEMGLSVRCLVDSNKFSYLTVSDISLKTISNLDFRIDNPIDTLVVTNSSAEMIIDISSIYNKNSAFISSHSSFILTPGDSIQLIMTFNPLNKDIYLDTLFIQSNDPYKPLITIPLSGTFPLEARITDSTNVSCYDYSNGSATVTPSLGYPPYHYQWDDPFNSTDSIVTGLSANYFYHVTITDSLGWSITDSIILSQPELLTSQITDSTNISCYGYANGSATITPIGGTTPFSYFWDDPSGTTDSIVTGLRANLFYNVTITDANDCVTSNGITLTQPNQLTCSVEDSSSTSCYGYSDGFLDILVTGGTPSYNYNWDGPDGFQSTDNNINGLSAGEYILTVTDANGCIKIDTFQITEPSELLTSVTSDTLLCYGENSGSISVAITGGTLGYTTQWYRDPELTLPIQGETDITLDNMPGGTYYVHISDLNQCTKTDSGVITEPPMFEVTMDNKKDVTCYGYSDGQATLTFSGGTPPYSHPIWLQTPSTSTTLTLIGLSAGELVYTFYDANGCTAPVSITIQEPEIISISMVTDPILCHGDCTPFNISITGGTLPLSYEINPPPVNSCLYAGSYTVTVSDATGCKATGTYDITEPSLLIAETSTSPTCYEDATGTVTTTVSGGTPPYQYLWNTNASTPSLSGLAKGIYTITITDNNACDTVVSDSVTEYPEIITGQITGQTEVNPSDEYVYSVNGKPTSVFTWILNGGSIISGQGTNSINVKWNSIGSGLVSVIETDENGCKGDTVRIDVSIGSTGIDNTIENELRIYPNPSSDISIIEFPNPNQEVYHLILTNLSGKVLKIIDNITEEKIEINRHGLRDGMYLIELRGTRIYRGKILIE